MANNVEIVTRMYDCFNVADLDTIKKEIFAEDIDWHLPGRHPLAGTKNGADEVLAFFHQLNKSGVNVTLIKIDNYGEDTVVEVHRGAGVAGTAHLDAVNCTHYTIVNGKIQHVQVYMSDQYAADNFFCEVYKYKPIPERLAE